jgi:hypothetical protein
MRDNGTGATHRLRADGAGFPAAAWNRGLAAAFPTLFSLLWADALGPQHAVYRASICRASAGVATLSPSRSMMRTAFSTSAALLGANSPLPR